LSALHSLVLQLEGVVCAEIAGKDRQVAIIALEIEAVKHNKPKKLEAAVRELERELTLQVERGTRREKLFAGIGAQLRIAPGALTLTSIAERTGSARLAELRTELRDKTALVLKQNRRLSALARMNQRMVEDLLKLLLGDEHGERMDSAGALVDAEA
jgi:hypothetical protein